MRPPASHRGPGRRADGVPGSQETRRRPRPYEALEEGKALNGRHHPRSRRSPARQAALAASAAALLLSGFAGCGIGPASTQVRDVELTVTRDFGAHELVRATEDEVPEGDTVLRLLDRHAQVGTAHGGGFVQSIEGEEGTGEGGGEGGRFADWFFYVNGIEGDRGAGSYEVNEGDRVWWDYREWTAAMRVPAVVGSFPEPFAHGQDGRAFPTRIDCLGDREACDDVASTLQDEGVAASVAAERVRAGAELLRIVVGTWEDIRGDRVVRGLADGPEVTGVFASFDDDGRLVLFDSGGRDRHTISSGGGLIAALGVDDAQPVWVIAGTDEEGLRAAVERTNREDLRDAYALAVEDGDPTPLPVR